MANAPTTGKNLQGILKFIKILPAMKSVRFSLPLWFATSVVLLADSSPPATPEDGLPEFEVLESRTERVLREEPAPLPDMKPVRKVVDVTVDVVKDPKIPEPQEPAPTVVDPEKAAALRVLMAARPRPVFLNLSAVVYDHECTLLRWRVMGTQGTQGTQRKRVIQGTQVPQVPQGIEYEAWSNIDWELLCGHGRLTHNGVEYNLFASLFLYDTAGLQRRAVRLGTPYVPPQIPGLPPDETPAFVVTKGDAADAAATAPITALHEYFTAHRAELVAALDARKEAQRQREAELRANPPEPEDVTVKFWQRENQVTRPTPSEASVTTTPPDAPQPNNAP
jgi:hypothetical protein